MDPARMFKESLTSRPELENSQGHKPPLVGCFNMSAHLRKAAVAAFSGDLQHGH